MTLVMQILNYFIEILCVLLGASYIQSAYSPFTCEMQGSARTAFQLNFHCWMATCINKRSAPAAVGRHSQPVKEVLTAISGFLEGVLKTYNLFGNFIFLHEAAQEAML